MADGIVEYIVRLTDKTKAGTASAVKGSKQLENQTEQTSRAVDKLGDESAQTSRQLDRMGKESRSASGGLGGLARGLSGAVSSAGGLTAGIGGLVGALGVGALVGTLTAATSAVVAFGQEIADLRNDITDASTRSGIAADTLQGLRLAAEGSGLAFSALTPGLDQFGRRLVQAADGGNATAEAFEALGVEVVDAEGNLRSADTVLRETLAALNGMESSGERSALAMETLGKSGGRLLQALSGSELEDFVSVARDFGVNVGPEAAKSAGDWQRASAELSLVVDGLKASLFDAVGGADLLFAVADELIFAFSALSGGASAAARVLGDAFSDAFAPLKSLSDALADLIEGLQALGRGDFSGSLDALTDAAANLGQALGEAPAAITAGVRALSPALLGDVILAGISGAVEGITGTGAQRVAGLRLARGRIRGGGAAGSQIITGGDGGGDGGGGGGITPGGAERADLAALAARAAGGVQRVGSSMFEFGEVLRAGSANVDGQLSELQDALDAEAIAATRERRAARIEGVQTGIGIAGQVIGGDLGGGISAGAGAAGLATLGAVGAGVSAVQTIGATGVEGIEDQLEQTREDLIAGLEALPELIGEVLPQFAVDLVSTLIPALIEAGPELFKAILIELPVTLAKAIGEVFRDIFQGPRSERGERLGRAAGAVGGLTFGPGGAILGSRVGERLGEGVDDVLGSMRDNRSRSAARTASDGQASGARASDRLAAMSTRARRRGATVVAQNPYDQLAQQYDAQYGTYGRATSTTIRGA